MATLVDVGGGQKLRSLFAKLEERIPEEALRPTAMKIAMDVAKRAPTPDQEFQTMMYGGWNMTSFKVSASSRAGRFTHFGAITDSDNRVRFYKPVEHYLQSYIPTSFGVQGLWAGIGYIPVLDQVSGYTYVNYAQFGPNAGNTYTHEVTYPFWQSWEYGGVFRITPHDYGSHAIKGLAYSHYLKPLAGLNVLEMTKTIPAKFMFTGTDIGAFVDSTLIPGVKKIVKSL